MTEPSMADRACVRSGGPAVSVQALLEEIGSVRVAVSGGVDSMTLGILAHRVLGEGARMFHARSPAVPAAATRRVREVADREGWRLRFVDAGEFDDDTYRSNPYDRCFHCKHHLYFALGCAGSPGVTLSGTNLDDLADYRPGLRAAEALGVRHPFVECGLGKSAIRSLCRDLGYPDLAALAASPCLSSRIETGLRIEPEMLGVVDRVEEMLRRALGPKTVRCRVRRAGLVVELDEIALSRLTEAERRLWEKRVGSVARAAGILSPIRFEPYRMGSAFVADD